MASVERARETQLGNRPSIRLISLLSSLWHSNVDRDDIDKGYVDHIRYWVPLVRCVKYRVVCFDIESSLSDPFLSVPREASYFEEQYSRVNHFDKFLDMLEPLFFLLQLELFFYGECIYMMTHPHGINST